MSGAQLVKEIIDAAGTMQMHLVESESNLNQKAVEEFNKDEAA